MGAIVRIGLVVALAGCGKGDKGSGDRAAPTAAPARGGATTFVAKDCAAPCESKIEHNFPNLKLVSGHAWFFPLSGGKLEVEFGDPDANVVVTLRTREVNAFEEGKTYPVGGARTETPYRISERGIERPLMSDLDPSSTIKVVKAASKKGETVVFELDLKFGASMKLPEEPDSFFMRGTLAIPLTREAD